jgi:hypothetical protein
LLGIGYDTIDNLFHTLLFTFVRFVKLQEKLIIDWNLVAGVGTGVEDIVQLALRDGIVRVDIAAPYLAVRYAELRISVVYAVDVGYALLVTQASTAALQIPHR